MPLPLCPDVASVHVASAPTPATTDGSTRGRRSLATAAALVVGLLAPLLVGVPAASARTATEAGWAAAVQSVINSERHDHRLPALAANSHLVSAARSHNLRMVKVDALSHQCRGESSLGTRLSRAGYRWTSAAENIGWSSTVSKAAIIAVQRAMYHEKAPNDGHRRNQLSRAYNELGVDIYIDSRHHKVWLTIDFGHR